MKKDRIHLKAQKNWINDPNGFIYYKGKYHLFYQCFPYALQWGTMHWGHAVSTDLVNWEHQGIALFPTKYEDQNGCFSGSAIENEGRMYLYYTGVRYEEVNPENIHQCPKDQYVSSQMMLISEDGMQFDNFHGKRLIIPSIGEKEIGDKIHTRDPKVWQGKDAWYMVLGSTNEERRGQLLFYRSENLRDWEFVNHASKDEDFGWMWECPDYFETEGGKALVFSPMGFLKDGKQEENQAVCMKVEFEEKTCTMTFPEEYQFLDYGLDLYAPQSTVDEEGRRVLVAWLRMPEAVDGEWIGMFCIPRVVEVKDNHIYFRVHPNIEKVYTRRITSPGEAGEFPYRVSLELAEGEEINIGGYRIARKGQRIYTDRTEVFQGHEECRLEFATPELREGDYLDIYVDKNLIEVFVNRGEYVISNAVYGLTGEMICDAGCKPQIYAAEE